ncbi:MAG: Mut7-C RNAse domain-containing protein [Dehalococcoidales bacterium]|nr:MAG: Mut7-C RNAse domain-containing protein [Dehalococcoidales bacterium]
MARWLRMMGYDTALFDHGDDGRMIRIALDQGRVIVTRDTQVMKRRVITSGRLRAVLVSGDRPEEQIKQVMASLQLESNFRPFSLCMECNHPLEERSKAEVAGLVPPYVFKTQDAYVQCPNCFRVYWKGTHWQAMVRKLEGLGDDD